MQITHRNGHIWHFLLGEIALRILPPNEACFWKAEIVVLIHGHIQWVYNVVNKYPTMKIYETAT